MERHQSVRVKQFGNVLQVILEIPWNEVYGENQWKKYLDKKAAETPPPSTYWQDLQAQIIQTWNATHNISATAKLCKSTYYIANDVIRKEKSRQNRQRRQAAIEESKRLAAAHTKTKDIARIMGKSPETIRLWLKS